MKIKKNSVMHLAMIITKVQEMLNANGAELRGTKIVIDKNENGKLQTQITVALQPD